MTSSSVRQTSLDAFAGLRASERLGLRQKMVYDALLAGPANDRMLAAATGLPINQVTPRRGELVSLGLVVEDRVDDCPFSGRKSTFWRIDSPWAFSAGVNPARCPEVRS